jgi:hypothetical protein
VSRAALVRALVRLGLDSALAPEFVTALGADTVRRGRAGDVVVVFALHTSVSASSQKST